MLSCRIGCCCRRCPRGAAVPRGAADLWRDSGVVDNLAGVDLPGTVPVGPACYGRGGA
ncbi:hypothetical protein UO65_1969 [Actinokineospora spheciospongiae]|uniref:Uncharacterized protein n=1 Tax=Actinokineospora spheciospongiae TaxID=909613 RepID=W7J0T7_9PSEU|nr:hypothetical protein UO65_1969 [Actinokineospora spheciospongiae]